jgi:hypothetical protein
MRHPNCTPKEGPSGWRSPCRHSDGIAARQKRATLTAENMKRLGFTLSTFILLTASSARADDGTERPRRTFYVEPSADGCSDSTSALAEAITVTCDAAQASCRASTVPGGADRRLVLDCVDADHWRLDAFDASGTTEWTADLSGSEEDRIDTGAMTVLRFERSEDNPRPATRGPSAPPTPSPYAAADAPRDGRKSTAKGNLAKGMVYGGFGVAALAVVIGVALKIDVVYRRRSLRDDERVATVCSDGPCPSSSVESTDPVGKREVLADVAFGVAIAGATAGAVGLVLWPRSDVTRVQRRPFTPVIGLGSVGLRSEF